MERYLDNAATTKPCAEAAAAVMSCISAHYGNPSSLHRKGLEAQHEVNTPAIRSPVLWAARHKKSFSLPVRQKVPIWRSAGRWQHTAEIERKSLPVPWSTLL